MLLNLGRDTSNERAEGHHPRGAGQTSDEDEDVFGREHKEQRRGDESEAAHVRGVTTDGRSWETETWQQRRQEKVDTIWSISIRIFFVL